MVPASAVAPALLGRPAGDLLLRVCGTHYDGRVVRLSSAKCTVGSGERCTLRLRAPGIDPVHCLILRGGERTVIRRWSPNTRLNGRAFQDAPLNPGDRLSIGSLEFEVLSPAQAGQPTEPTSLTNTPNESHTTLVHRIAELERENRDLTYSLENHRQDWHAQRQQWEEERRAADGAMANRWRQLEVLEAELDARRQQSESGGAASETQDTELDDLRLRLDGERQQVAEERRQITAERDHWQQERQTSEAELAARSQRLEEETNRLTALRQQFEESQARHAADVDQRRKELEQATAELESRRQHADESQRAMSDESQRATADAHGAEVDELRRKLEGERRQVIEDRGRWEHERQAADAELAARSRKLEEDTSHLTARHREFEESQAKLAQQTAQIEELRRQLDAERQSWQASRDEAKERLTVRSESLDQRAADLDQRQEQLEREFSELAEQRDDLEARRAEIRDQRGASHTEPARESKKSAEGNDLLARLRELQAYKPGSDEGSSEETLDELTPEEEAADEAAERLAEEIAADEVPLESTDRRSQSRQGHSAGHEGGDEESIEDYMARLIHRMRGGSEGEAPTKQHTAAKKAAAEKAAEIARVEATREPDPQPQKLAASEFIPRSSAPEQSSRLSAMRELANMSARTAIGTHHKSRFSREASHMVMMAGASASLGLVLLFWCSESVVLMIASAGGFAFAGYCVWQSIVHGRESRKEHDMNTAFTHIDYKSPHHKLWLKVLPSLERFQQKLQNKFASGKKKK